MRKPPAIWTVGPLCAVLFLPSVAHAQDKELTETGKIEALIRIVEGLEGAVFIRNGTQYDCRKAAEHLRSKWQWKRKEIKTARDFIRLAASRSSISGRPYLIRFKDGREVKSGDFLLAELLKLEGVSEKGGE